MKALYYFILYEKSMFTKGDVSKAIIGYFPLLHILTHSTDT